MRGSELVALDLADIETKPARLLITIRSSKTDQEQRGQTVPVAHGSNAVTDPVAALAAWIKIRGGHPGALFTRIWDSHISDQRLGTHVVARMLRERAIAAGLDGTRITAHSLRAGHATVAGDGVDDPDVEVLDEQDDVGSGVGSSDADVAQLAGDAQGDGAGFVDAVVSDAVAGVGVAAGPGDCLGELFCSGPVAVAPLRSFTVTASSVRRTVGLLTAPARLSCQSENAKE